MQQGTDQGEQILSIVLEALRRVEDPDVEAIEALPAAVYTTDPEGHITYFNRACVEFSGRVPVAGEDRWCVTWKLFTEEGAALPHDQCPMAVAIKQRRPVRGVTAIAERPDGSRVRFVPFPTPVLDDVGQVVVAVNVLIDVTDRAETDHSLSQAQRCRRLARSIDDRATASTLIRLAEEYELEAQLLRLH